MRSKKHNPLFREESRQIWTVVGIALTLTTYRISIEFIQEVREAFQPYTTLPVAELVTNGLFLWLLILLFMVFRQWRQSLVRRRALEVVISSISF